MSVVAVKPLVASAVGHSHTPQKYVTHIFLNIFNCILLNVSIYWCENDGFNNIDI